MKNNNLGEFGIDFYKNYNIFVQFYINFNLKSDKVFYCSSNLGQKFFSFLEKLCISSDNENTRYQKYELIKL